MIDTFISQLTDYRGPAVFNPWAEVDPDHDADGQGAVVRRRQLTRYLAERIGTADSLLCAEAIGYQGGHFSGIPMTSERLLLGGLRQKNISPEMVFTGLKPQRTSRDDLKPQGFVEPTATVVWGFFAEHAIDPYRVVLWNAFPWHPYHQHRGMLSNRTPTEEELASGHQVLRSLLAMGRFRRVIAVGEKSASQLDRLGISADKVRHPANGGAGRFRRQLYDLLCGLE